MLSSPVLDRFDVVEKIGFRFGSRSAAGAMHTLIPQSVEEALGRRIVPAFFGKGLTQVTPNLTRTQ